MGLNGWVQHYRKAILLLVVVLCFGGFYASQTLPVAIFPDLNAPRIIVTADAGNTPIPTVLANITRPLENAVSGVPNVTKVSSLTQRGGDELDVNFSWGTDMPATLQQVQARIAQVQAALPAGTNVTAERLNPSVFPVMGYSLYSKSVSPQELRRLALYTLRPRLLRVPGVREIAVQGGDTPDFLVQLNPTSLLTRGVSAQDVETALAKNNEVNSVGYYDQSFLRYQVLVSGLFTTANDISNVTVAVKNHVPVTIGEVGTVTHGIEPHTVETSGDGHVAVLLSIIKQPTGNTVQVADGIKQALADAKSALPPGITITNFYDQSEIVIGSQHSVLEALILGGALALIVLMLFLGNLRTAAIVLIILPFTIVISFALMKLLGQTMNIMTLGALAVALGLVIDDGIVVVENMFHELENGKERSDAIAAGLKAITPAMVGSSLTTMAAFLPLTFLNDLTGQFFGPLALIMIATLTVSLALALLLTPILAGWLLPKKAAAHDSKKSNVFARILGFFPRQFDSIVRVYARSLRWCLAHKAVVLLLLLPVGFGTVLLYQRIPTGFFPEFDEGGFILDYQLPAGTSLTESSAVSGQIETVLAKTPEVVAWSRQTGAQAGFDITTQNVGDMTVRLKSNRTRDINAVMDDIRSQVEAKYPAAQVDFHQTLQDEIGDIAGSPSPVQIKIFGPDQATLEDLAQKVDGVIAKLPFVQDDASGIVHSSPESVLKVNTQEAQRFGLTTDDIRQAVQAALQGVEPTQVQQGEQAVGVRVVLAQPSQALTPELLPNISIASPVTGGDVPVSEVADVVSEPGASQITRENQRQMIAVTAGLTGNDLGGNTLAIQKVVSKQVPLPEGYTIEYGGLYASQQQSFAELGQTLLITMMLVFTLLVFQFRSIRQAVALLLAAILSLFGVLAALMLTNTPLNISSFTGAIMIIGIITENGIVLFAFFNHLRHENPSGDLTAQVQKAGEERLRPILMTTIGAILALMPLALGLGAGAALQKPLAIAVIGGLSVSTLFTLIVAPVLYVTLEGLTRRPK
jgi:CzcA family heavy metal efflux pump